MSRFTFRHFLCSLGLLLVSAASCVFAVYEIKTKAGTLGEQIKVLAAERSQETVRYKTERVYEESKEERAIIDTYFLRQGSDSIDFLNQVETLAPQVGVDLKTENLEEFSDKKTGAKWIDVQFSFSGTQADVERFVQVLERLPYFSQLTSVSLKVRALDNWQANVSMRIFLTAS